ncbi:MAG TPA: FAD-dependent oxidoreductase, partial [Gemmatales bacterium]|nr:FAD-dependent oxidoreductase [Gemmatales bacterium]
MHHHALIVLTSLVQQFHHACSHRASGEIITCDIAIIGGGVIGLTLAYLLAKEKLSVTVLDKSDLGREASWAGAGILPAGNPRRAKSPMGKLRAQAVSFFPEFSAELQALTGINNGYWRCGGLNLLAKTVKTVQKQRVETY